MSRLIVITSGKGGVGKTTTTINLGAAINYFGKDVLIVDGNMSTPNVGIHLGSPEVPINLNHVLNGKAEVFEGVYEHESGIKIMPSSITIKDLGKIDESNLKSLKKDFKKISEYVSVDSAAGLGAEAMAAIKMADELILVSNPEMPAITDALKAIKLAEQMKIPVTGVIMTRVKKNGIELDTNTVKEMLEGPILGKIHEEITISEALNEKDAVVHTHPKSKAARAYKEIASNLVDEEYDSKKDREKLIKRILQKLGMNKKK